MHLWLLLRLGRLIGVARQHLLGRVGRAAIADVIRLGRPPKAGLVAAGVRNGRGIGSSQDRL